MKILVVVAHPDDEVLGCGGTISRLSNEGNDVRVLILSEGIASRYTGDAPPSEVEVRRKQSKAVALLFDTKIMCHNYPDNQFDTVSLLKVAKSIELSIEAFSPEIVFTHSGGDLNVDHQLTYRAVLTATRPTEDCPVRALYSFEIPSSTEWSFQSIAPIFRPSLFYDISETIGKKTEAMSIYEGEARAFPHPRSAKALQAIASRWGSVVGVHAAEAFEVVREIK